MPRRKIPEPESRPKRRAPNTGSVVVRADSRILVYLPKDLAPKRRPIYGPGRRQRFVSREQATTWLDAEIVHRRNPTSRAATLREPLGAYLLRWWKLYSPGWPARTARVYARRIRLFVSIADVRLGN